MGTVWDKIYKDYQNGGPAWASLSKDIVPEFQKFVETSTFPIKSAFDIGFGTGKYLQFLSVLGFTVAGIDSSDTALDMAKAELEHNEGLELADMFTYDISPSRYDFIFSVATIHHGTKDQVASLIQRIHTALAPDGKVFIDMPNLDSRNEWQTYKTAKEIAPGTFVPQEGPEQGLPHSIFSREEVEQMFSSYQNLAIIDNEKCRWIITASK